MKGIKFKRKDDDFFEYYDPVQNWEETEDNYTFWIHGYYWVIPKNTVETFEWYNLCSSCGYELIEGVCNRWDRCKNKNHEQNKRKSSTDFI